MSDLIRREDAIAILEDLQSKHLQFCLIPFRIAIEKVQAIPSADRPQGEWILLEPRYPIEQKVYWNKEQALADTKGNGAIERRKCSCCGYAKSFMCHMKDEQIKLWNFCPNCGCRMKGADDE